METQRILVVDDEKNIRLTLAQALEFRGCWSRPRATVKRPCKS